MPLGLALDLQPHPYKPADGFGAGGAFNHHVVIS
jgi:hypothetical protein